MLKFLREQLKQLQEQRAALVQSLDAVIAPAEAEKRSLTADETSKFDEARGKVVAADADILALEQRIVEAAAIEERSANARDAVQTPDAQQRTGSAYVTREPVTYDPTGRSSYFLDLARVSMQRGDADGGVEGARARLARHAKELEVEMPRREKRREEQSDREVRTISGVDERTQPSVFEKRVNPNRTDGQGGYFVPPLWLIDEYINLPRFGRTTANLVRNLTLPAGTDSINLPKVSTGTATAVQTADAGAVQSTDMTDTTVNAPVRTIAGQQDIAIQLLDQSPIAFDEVVFADLMADYNATLDTQVISGSGSSGQMTGILNVSGINAVTFTNASPTLPLLWLPLLQSASKVATGRKLPATGVVMTPSMWYWALSQLDTTNRPLLLGNGAAFNPAGQGGQLEVDGPAGTFTYGLPAYLDGNIPSNLGGGTNETRVITARWDDLFLFEGAMRSRVLSEILSNTLQVRLQVYGYAAFLGNRRPTSISVISGTGVISPTGF